MSGAALAFGVTKLVLAAVAPVLIVYVVLRADRIGDAVVRGLRRCRLLPARRPAPSSLVPVERIAADLCRLSTAIRDVPRGVSCARHRGLIAAYDEVLAAGALALDVPHALADLPLGMDRDLERLRVEGALQAAGLRFGPRKRQDTP